MFSILWELRGTSETEVSNRAKRTVLVTFCDKNAFQKQLREERLRCLTVSECASRMGSMAEGLLCDDREVGRGTKRLRLRLA